MTDVYGIGIIGSADGPTAIFINGRFPWEIFLIAAIALGVGIWYIRRSK